MTTNQEPHVVYQPAYAPAYQPGAPMSVWNQPPNQNAAYAISFPQGDMGYVDKGGYGGYPPLPYQPHDNGEMMRQQHYQHQFAQSAQWQYQQPGQSHYIPTYATNFNATTDPAYQTAHPNMNRPPPNMKRDDFHGTIGMLENPAQTAAAYTASWVSSTSSIPPEMRDEPETEVNVGHWEQRGRQGSGQWQEGQKNDKAGGTSSKKERKDEPRELTFDERLEKARMQKDWVENQGFENNPNNAAAGAPTMLGGSNTGGVVNVIPIQPNIARGGASGTFVRGGRGGRSGGISNNGGRRYEGAPRENEIRHDGNNIGAVGQGHPGRGYKRGGGGGVPNQMGIVNHPGAQMHYQQQQQQQPQQQQQQQQPQQPQIPYYAPQNVPQYVIQNPLPQGVVDQQLLATITALQNNHLGYPVRRVPVLPGPFGMIPHAPIQQDVKFRNTWLDAQNYPLSYGAMMGLDNRGRSAYRGRGGSRGGLSGRGGNRRNDRRDDKRDEQKLDNVFDETSTAVTVTEDEHQSNSSLVVEQAAHKNKKSDEKQEKEEIDDLINDAQERGEPKNEQKNEETESASVDDKKKKVQKDRRNEKESDDDNKSEEETKEQKKL